MPQLGMFQKTVLDSQGRPISGASVEIRTQGAFVTSTQAGPTYTVNDPGGIVSGTSTCVANTTSAPARACTAATATTVTFGILGLGSLSNNDRISVSSPLPTLYADAQGAETKTNPLETDANGYCFAWLPVVPVDVKTSATGYGTKLETDVLPEGQEYVGSNMFSQAGATAFRRGTTRTITAGRLMTLENPLGTTIKWEVDYAGNETVGGNLAVTGTTALTGNVTMTGDLTVDDITMDDLTVDAVTASGLITANAGITCAAPFTYSGATGNFSLTAGSIETADLATNCVVVTRTADGTADQTFNAAAYNTANYVDVTSCSVTFTPASTSSEIVVMAHCPNKAAGASAYDSWWAIRNGSGTILHEAENSVPASAKSDGPTLLYRVTGLSGSQTFKVSGQCVTANMVANNSSWNSAQKTRIVVMEFKK